MEFEMTVTCYLPKLLSFLRSIFQSFIGLWVKIRHRNKSACFKLNPVQSRRSQSTTCLRKGHLLRFPSYSTANDLWYDSELIVTKVCSQNGCKRNTMFEGQLRRALTGQALIFNIKIVWAICYSNNHLLCYWPTIHNSI